MKKAVVVALFACTLVPTTVGCPKKEKTTGTSKEGDKTLTLTKPSDVTITRGDTAKISISIDRTGFTDAVDVKFEKLPKGVKVEEKEAKIAANEKSASFNLKADADADIVKNHEAMVIVEGGGAKASMPFNISVKDK
jgi:hypothetical protein